MGRIEVTFLKTLHLLEDNFEWLNIELEYKNMPTKFIFYLFFRNLSQNWQIVIHRPVPNFLSHIVNLQNQWYLINI